MDNSKCKAKNSSPSKLLVSVEKSTEITTSTLVNQASSNILLNLSPGQKLEIKTKVESWSRGICKGFGQGFTEGELACEASMVITIPEILKKFLPNR